MALSESVALRVVMGIGPKTVEPERFGRVQARPMIIPVGAGCFIVRPVLCPRIDQAPQAWARSLTLRVTTAAVLQRRRGNRRVECCHGLARRFGLGAQAGPIPSGIACEGQSLVAPTWPALASQVVNSQAATRGWQAHDTSLQFSERQGRDIQIRGRALCPSSQALPGGAQAAPTPTASTCPEGTSRALTPDPAGV